MRRHVVRQDDEWGLLECGHYTTALIYDAVTGRNLYGHCAICAERKQFEDTVSLILERES